MLSLAEMRGRYVSFVSIVARRLQVLGCDPDDILIVSPETFGLAAITALGRPPIFAMHVEKSLQNGNGIEQLADRFVDGWLLQVAIDETRVSETFTNLAAEHRTKTSTWNRT